MIVATPIAKWYPAATPALFHFFPFFYFILWEKGPLIPCDAPHVGV